LCGYSPRYIKGAFLNARLGQGYGQYVGLDSEGLEGKNAVRVGDGYHDYLNVGIVSCSCLGLVAPGQTVLAASMRMRPSRVFGPRNIYSADRNGVVSQAMRVDMVCFG
jgi:hypothetical protein